MLARIRLFHNFCTIVKEWNETRRAKYRRIISQFSRDQLNCLSTNQPKDDRTFRASTSIISCVRERTFYAICVVNDDRYFKNTKSFDRQEKFCRRAIYSMIDGSRNTSFLLMKNFQWSRKIENGGNSGNLFFLQSERWDWLHWSYEERHHSVI